jgi:hypothetical protein
LIGLELETKAIGLDLLFVGGAGVIFEALDEAGVVLDRKSVV